MGTLEALFQMYAAGVLAGVAVIAPVDGARRLAEASWEVPGGLHV